MKKDKINNFTHIIKLKSHKMIISSHNNIKLSHINYTIITYIIVYTHIIYNMNLYYQISIIKKIKN